MGPAKDRGAQLTQAAQPDQPKMETKQLEFSFDDRRFNVKVIPSSSDDDCVFVGVEKQQERRKINS